jgi:hypothetical protein
MDEEKLIWIEVVLVGGTTSAGYSRRHPQFFQKIPFLQPNPVNLVNPVKNPPPFPLPKKFR